MIKVEHTKSHKVPKGFRTKSNGEKVLLIGSDTQLVADAELVLVEGTTTNLDLPVVGEIMVNSRMVKPILISKTEKIEAGDWAYDTVRFELFKSNDTNTNSNCRKVLALPEHFSPEQLQMIVDGKLKDGDKLMVECEYTTSLPRFADTKSLPQATLEPPAYIEGYSSIKLNPHITIYPVEEKNICVSCEKEKKIYHLCLDCALKLGRENPVEEKMYTKAEFETIAQLYGDYREKEGRRNVATMTFNKWFEQNVK